MENIKLDRLLLKTAFCCMACDGTIDQREVETICNICSGSPLFADVDPLSDLNELRKQLNANGTIFIQRFLNKLKRAELSSENQLEIIRIAMQTIRADEVVEYAEIRFFKALRACLKISNEAILEVFPDLENYLEDDIGSDSYFDRLVRQYFDSVELPQFSPIV